MLRCSAPSTSLAPGAALCVNPRCPHVLAAKKGKIGRLGFQKGQVRAAGLPCLQPVCLGPAGAPDGSRSQLSPKLLIDCKRCCLRNSTNWNLAEQLRDEIIVPVFRGRKWNWNRMRRGDPQLSGTMNGTLTIPIQPWVQV